MRNHKTAGDDVTPWRVPVAVEDIAEAGQHFVLVPDQKLRAALARLTGIRDLPHLEARFEARRHGDGGLRIVGQVVATVAQNCVVTLEPLVNDVEEDVDVVFLPRAAAEPQTDETASRDVKWDDPEPLAGSAIDLGALATEFLIIGIDPYPRKPDAVFEPLQDANADGSPFAVLAGLAKGRDDH